VPAGGRIVIAKRLANASTSAAPDTGPAVPAATGAPARRASRRAATLSASTRMAAGGGPIQVSPASVTAWANPASSDR
jgi:hypothetical protein